MSRKESEPMGTETVTKLTTAFNPAGLLDTFVSFAPFILGVAGTIMVVGLVKWAIKTVRRKLSGGVA